MLEAAPRMDNIIEAMEPKVVGYHASHITPLYGNGYAKHYANICMEQTFVLKQSFESHRKHRFTCSESTSFCSEFTSLSI